MVRFVGCIIYDGIGLTLMLPFQDNTQNMTLNEGIECYRNYLVQNNRKILIDESGSTLIRDHDATHVIFGLDISIDQETILDTWVMWGCSFKWKYLLGYSKLPEIKELQRTLFKELGIKGFLKLYWNNIAVKRKAFVKAFKMKKKWPFKMPEEFLDMKISDLREMHGIKILLKEELNYTPTKWTGSFD